jgi:two-component system sensor histidine kinase/response regulator
VAPGMTARTKVLVVDDHDVNLLLARHTLEDAGYEVVLAANGMEALARFVEQPADCVLLDVRMPDIDGFAVCERLRSLPGGAEMPVLFLTALRDVETFDRASRVDADDFLTKPVRPQELVARVRTAIELRRVRAELREHYGLLKKQRDDLMRLQLQKERLMAFVVHDLKNPVHTMDLHAQLLLLEELPADAREAVLHIRAGARRLSQMILNLLDVSKADEGRLVPQRSEVDLVGLIADVLAETAVLATDRSVALRSEAGGVSVRADRDLLRRTLTNLVENAIRYAPEGTAVTISAVVSAGGTQIRVADAGRGIPAALRDRVFDPFVQGDSGKQDDLRANRGLGLSFCKTAVEAHGGAIWVEDGSPGAVFCLRFPDGE